MHLIVSLGTIANCPNGNASRQVTRLEMICIPSMSLQCAIEGQISPSQVLGMKESILQLYNLVVHK